MNRRGPRLIKISNLPRFMQVIIRRFMSQHLAWSTPRGAQDECTTASELFIQDLCEKYPSHMANFEHGVQSVRKHRFYKCHISRVGGTHDVARVGALIIDWTARQFNHQMAWPRIWRDLPSPSDTRTVCGCEAKERSDEKIQVRI